MGTKCCANCFAHNWLKEFILDNNRDKGDCDYCGAEGMRIIEVSDLYDPFYNLMSLYMRQSEALWIVDLSPHGEPVLDLIQEDYEVFDDDLVASGKAEPLLKDIMQSMWDDDSGESPIDPNDLYVRYSDEWGHATMAEQWNNYCSEVKVHSRRKPKLPALFDEELGKLEVVIPQGTIFYRSRLGYEPTDAGIQPYQGSHIGAPPANKARPGRANKRGEAVLYAADEELTAIAEQRPARGNLVSVAELYAVRNLRLANLRGPIHPSNPFADEVPHYAREVEGLLLALAEELSRPLRHNDDIYEYRPCQMLTRQIRQSGYDGIRYPSAMNPGGSNLVLFNPDLIVVGASKLVEIDNLEVTYIDYCPM